jgi:hypothetical protein
MWATRPSSCRLAHSGGRHRPLGDARRAGSPRRARRRLRPQSVVLRLADHRLPAATSSRRSSTSRRSYRRSSGRSRPCPTARCARDRTRPRGHPQRPGLVADLVDELDITTLQRGPAPASLPLNAIGRVRVRLAEPVPLDDYADLRRTGASCSSTRRTAPPWRRVPTWPLPSAMAGSRVLTVGVPIGRHASTSPTLKRPPWPTLGISRHASAGGPAGPRRGRGHRGDPAHTGTAGRRSLNVDVIAPDVSTEIREATGAARWRQRRFQPRDVLEPEPAWLAHAATAAGRQRGGRDRLRRAPRLVRPGRRRRRLERRLPWPTAPSGPWPRVIVAVTGGGDRGRPRSATRSSPASTAGCRRSAASAPSGLTEPWRVGLLWSAADRDLDLSPSAGDSCSPRRTSSSPTGSARDLLDVLSSDVEVVDVGKTPGHHPIPQLDQRDPRRACSARPQRRAPGRPPSSAGVEEEAIHCAANGIPVEGPGRRPPCRYRPPPGSR